MTHLHLMLGLVELKVVLQNLIHHLTISKSISSFGSVYTFIHSNPFVLTVFSQPQVRVLLVDMDVMPANLSTFFGRKGSEDTSIGPHLPINKQLLQMDSRCGAKCLSRLMHGWFDSIGKTSRHSNWMVIITGSCCLLLLHCFWRVPQVELSCFLSFRQRLKHDCQVVTINSINF